MTPSVFTQKLQLDLNPLVDLCDADAIRVRSLLSFVTSPHFKYINLFIIMNVDDVNSVKEIEFF